MSKRLVAISVAASLLLAPSLADAAARCLTPQERTAVNIRVLQTELMVAALSCRAVPGRDFTGQYNTFIKRHGDHLIGQSQILQNYFNVHYGKQARKHLDAFITALANDASRRSMTSPTFCDESVSLFQEALQIDRRELDAWSSKRAASYPVTLEACGADGKNQRATAAR